MQVCGINRGHSVRRLSLHADEGLVTSILPAVAIPVAAIGTLVACVEELDGVKLCGRMTKLTIWLEHRAEPTTTSSRPPENYLRSLAKPTLTNVSASPSDSGKIASLLRGTLPAETQRLLLNTFEAQHLNSAAEIARCVPGCQVVWEGFSRKADRYPDSCSAIPSGLRAKM